MSWLDLSRFQLAEPVVLWALLLLPLLLVLRERSTASHPPWRSFGAMVGRGLALLCLIVAVAQPFEESRRPDRSIAVVLDPSASMTTSRRGEARAWVETLEAERGDVPAIYVVAGDAPTLHRDADGALARLGEAPAAESGTALRGGLELALAHLPPARAREIVVLSDGAVNRGDPGPALQVAEVRDVAVHVVPLVARSVLLDVEEITATQDALAGDEVAVEVTVRSNAEQPVVVELLRSDVVVASQPVVAQPGLVQARLLTTPDQAGILDLTVRVRIGDGPEGVAARALRVLVRPRPAALVVGGGGAAAALRRAVQGYEPALDVQAVPELPVGPLEAWSLVVLLDPDLPGLGEPRIQALRTYVLAGGRLLMTGGGNGLVTDEPGVEPLAELLPVKFPKRKKKQRAPLAVVYCLDSSDSMAGGAKFELAAAALAQSLYLLPESARVGVIGFADFPEWIAPLAPFASSGPVIDALAGVRVRGGTSIYHALQAAYDALREDEALVKHVVLLSDGQSTTTFARSGDIVTAMKRRDITVSTIAVTKDSDRPEMERISEAGGGRAYYTESFGELPKLFLDEMIQVTRTNKVDESFQVLPIEGSPLLARVPDGAQWPSLDGFVRGEQRAGSELALATADGRPVLVQGRAGRGQITLFTSDVGGAWSAAWADWEGLGPLWEGVVDAILRPTPPERVSLEHTIDGTRARVWFHAVDDLRNPRHDLRVEAIIDGRDGSGQLRSEVVTLESVGPGRTSAAFELPVDGAALVRVAAVGVLDGGAPPPSGELVVSLAPTRPMELRGARANAAWLERAAQVTGGLVAPTPAAVLARPTSERVERIPRWQPPLWLALILLVLDVGWRRLRRLDAGGPAPLPA